MFGVISKIVLASEKGVLNKRGRLDYGGYGFIKDEAGHERFFHINDMINDANETAMFDTLKKGDRVSFEPLPGTKGNGLRADNVRREC